MGKRVKSCAWLAAVALMPSASAARHPYTVDDMLKVEEIGKVRFDPSGRHLIFERYGPFEEQTNFARSFIAGEQRSKIYTVDIATDGAPRPLFDQKPGEGYTIGGLSPDGRRLVFRHASDARFSEGIVDLANGTAREFAFTPDNRDAIDVRWTPSGGYASNVLRAGDSPYSFDLRSGRLDRLTALWRQSRDGKVSTATEIGSGRFARLQDAGVTLALANGADGTARTLGAGKYDYAFASPDGRLLAGLRDDPLVVDPTRPIEHGANINGVAHTLVVYDLSPGGGAIAPCKGCDVLATSLNWSPDGRYLAFVARAANATWDTPDFWVFDRRRGTATKQVLPGKRPHIGRLRGLWLDVRSAWIDGHLAVLLDREGDKPSVDRRNVRADWWLLDGGTPRNLTVTLDGETPQLIATTGDGAIVMSHDLPWRLSAAGKATPLASGVTGPLAEWQPPSRYGMLGYFDMQPVGTLVLQTRKTTPDQKSSVFFIDLASGKLDQVTAPAADAIIADASVASHRVAFLTTTDNVTTLTVAGVDGSQRPIVTINQYLREAVGGTPVRIDHKGPAGDERHSWLLLPPGFTSGHPLPTVVNVYPGSSCPLIWNRWTLNQVHALNDHILAARGYAVLYPCVPVDYEKVPRDPLADLVPQIFSGIDAAVAGGYVDPDRLAVQGQSYGGYTTGALVGLTGRFKSAVAQAGLYDLISAYGEFDQRERLDAPYHGLGMFGVSLAETSQLGMGAPPWKDPERYLRNSPLMHVDAVTTPILLINGDVDYVNTTQSEEFFTALTRLNKPARYVRYFGEDHVFNSPANIRDMWRRIFDWYGETLGPPPAVKTD